MKKLFLILVLSAFVISCGKKEETQTTPQQNQQQLTQTQPQQQTDPTKTEQSKQDATKKDETKKEDEKKKDSEKKKEDKQMSEKNEETSKEKIETKNTSDIDFASIFAKRCAKCHGKDLKGKKDGGPNLTADSVQNASDAKLIKIITNGVKAKTEDDEDMPSFKNKLTEEEIQAAVKFIKAH